MPADRTLHICYLLKRIEDRLQAMEERMDELLQVVEEWADMDPFDSDDFFEDEVDEDSEESSNDEDSEAMVQN
jgi:hypothetical protein